MALSIDFSVDDALMKVFNDMKDNTKIRSCIAIIESERIKLHNKPLPSSDNLNNDMEEIRKTITSEKIEACFVVLRIDDKNFGHIIYSPDGVKPNTRIMYASSSAHLRKVCGLPIGADDHVTDINEISSALYSNTSDCRKELMTEKERAEEEISKMAPAPAPVAMAGVACPLTDTAVVAVKEFSKGDIIAAVFTVGKGIEVENTFPKGTDMGDIVKGVPEGQPRYILMSYENKSWLVYVCPPQAKPKDRMPYASSKGSFISQVMDKASIDLVNRVEIDEAKEMEEAMKDHLKENDLPVNVAPVAPKSTMPKGPRMLI